MAVILASPDPAGDVLDGPRVPRYDPGWPLQSHPGQLGVGPVPEIITIIIIVIAVHSSVEILSEVSLTFATC